MPQRTQSPDGTFTHRPRRLCDPHTRGTLGGRLGEHSATSDTHAGKQQGGKHANVIKVTSLSRGPESSAGAHGYFPCGENPHGRSAGLNTPA